LPTVFWRLTDAIDERSMTDQVLDKMDLERERGITIKLKPVRIDSHSSQRGIPVY